MSIIVQLSEHLETMKSVSNQTGDDSVTQSGNRWALENWSNPSGRQVYFTENRCVLSLTHLCKQLIFSL